MSSFNSDKRIKERAAKYGCDGKCYQDKYICGAVDWCPATRRMEFLTTVMAVVTIIFMPIIFVAMFIFILFL